ncbi:hypothetical protein A2954_00590 [Candidatus Roizmanbacteria bacterium RIFCSPLOWO2_01_FULL_37_12]|uniref:Uncharacterized protein n=1 Tax=Candidatus Roizmanbacteria bacterium RIFCSPLOWO2_01_FULL_37_12 TaxID=1802056 RepID=A0A1F7I9T1_9BACT|nr:MAG: hypothetical protein A2954_00590 [Candidatus Roizmanbacteria bacterium RIFCSPLOWO2_01_FULL_37_12]
MFKNLKKLNIVRLFNFQVKERQMIFTVVIALFLLVNYLISGISLRYDASSGKAYTLSESTKKILHNLDDLVNVKFFVSSDLPARLIPLKTDVTDTLAEFKKEGKNKITLKILDPKKDDTVAKEARESGIPELQFSQLEQDKYAVTTAYFGIALAYAGREEIIPQVTDFENLEYNLTSAIYKLVKKDLPKISIIGLTDSSNPEEDPVASFKKVLGQQFNVESLDISSESTKTIDPTLKIILIFDSNSKEYSEREVKLLKEYLNKKGKIIFFVDGVWVSENLSTSAANHKLFSLLQEYGIKLEKNLILSTSSELVNFGGGQVSLLLPYPFWLRTDRFNPDLPYFSNVNQLVFPWVSSVILEKKNSLETKELVKTTKQSWQQKDNPPAGGFVLNPQSIPQPEEKELKEFLIAAESGKKDGGRIVVIPSSRFVLERYLGAGSSNLEFVLNIASNLASGGALSGIRSRVVSFYPLPGLPESQKDMFKYINILLLPALFGLWGGVRLFKRR